MQKTVKQNWRLMLAALALSLSGCAATLPPSVVTCPALPVMPSIGTPMPPVSYSISASEAIKTWRQMLTDSLATGKP